MITGFADLRCRQGRNSPQATHRGYSRFWLTFRWIPRSARLAAMWFNQMPSHYPSGIHFMTASTTGIISWDQVDDFPGLRRLDRVLSRLSDRQIIDALRTRPGPRPQRAPGGRPVADPGGWGGVPAPVHRLAGSGVAAQPGAAGIVGIRSAAAAGPPEAVGGRGWSRPDHPCRWG